MKKRGFVMNIEKGHRGAIQSALTLPVSGTSLSTGTCSAPLNPGADVGVSASVDGAGRSKLKDWSINTEAPISERSYGT